MRVGIEKQFACNDIGLYAEWTWYQTNDKEKTKLLRPDTTGAILTFNSNFVGGTGGLDTAITAFETGLINAKFKFSYNRVDVGLSKEYCFCGDSILKPYAAFTWGYFKEDLELSTNFNNATTTFFKSQDYKAKTSFSGYGAKLGFIGNWDLSCGFSFHTEGSLSGLWGEYKVDHSFFEDEGGTINAIQFISSFKFDNWQGRLLSQIRLGLQYETCFCSSYYLSAMLGWEHQALFDQTNWMVRAGQFGIDSNKSVANFYLQGLVLRVGFSF